MRVQFDLYTRTWYCSNSKDRKIIEHNLGGLKRDLGGQRIMVRRDPPGRILVVSISRGWNLFFLTTNLSPPERRQLEQSLSTFDTLLASVVYSVPY